LDDTIYSLHFKHIFVTIYIYIAFFEINNRNIYIKICYIGFIRYITGGVKKMMNQKYKMMFLRKKILKSLVCVLLSISFVLPGYLVTADDPTDKTGLDAQITGYTPTEPKENDTIIITAKITNNDETDVSHLLVRISIDSFDNIIDTKDVEILQTDTSVDISTQWMAQPGNHTVILSAITNISENFEIDPQDQIEIYDEMDLFVKAVPNQSNETPDTTLPIVTDTCYGDNVKYEHLSNGLIRATLPSPTVYNDECGKWEPADFDLYWNDESSEWKTKKSTMDVSFKNDLESTNMYRFEIDDSWIEYGLNDGEMIWYNPTEDVSEVISSASPPSLDVTKNEISYTDIFDDTVIVYKVLPFGVKENIILSSPPKYKDIDKICTSLVYTGELQVSNNLTFWIDEKEFNEEEISTNGKIEFRKTGEPDSIFWFPSPFAYDSNQKIENYTDCIYRLKKIDGIIEFSVEISADWLLSPDRVYPVYIDPTVLTEYPVDDTYARSYRHSTVYGYGNEFTVNPRSSDICRTFLKFDLSEIPSGATISSATLRYYYYRWWEANPVGRTNNLHKVTETWSEDSLTWDNKPGYNPTVFSSYIVPSSYGWIETDITSYIQDKVDGEADHGFMVKDNTETSMGSNTNPCMYSKEYGSYTPEIVIEYIEGGSSTNWASLTNGGTLTFSYSDANNARPQSNWDNMHDEQDNTYGYLDWHAGQWVKITFSGTKTIDQIKFYADQVGEHYIKYLRASDSTWVDVSGYMPESSDLQWYTYDFNPVEVDAILYDQVGQTPVSQGSCKIYEFQAFDNAAGGSSEYHEDFEDEIGLEWSTYCSSLLNGRNERSSYSVHGGSYSWRMDVISYNGNYNLNELILHVSVSDASYLNLSFFTREFGDETHNLPSSTFTYHTNADGISVSTDGVYWEPFWQYPSLVSSWTGFGPLDISEEILVDGDVFIKFQQYDNYQLATDGILWDDIFLESDGIISTIPTFEYCWREGESWDRSYDTNGGVEWTEPKSTDASDGEYTNHSVDMYSVDYAEYDFTVNTVDTYYFWIRGYHAYDSCCDIRIKWDGSQIGSSLNWDTTGGWEWDYIGSKSVTTTGLHTLKVEGWNKDYIRIDNLLITSNDGFTPPGKGVEGSYRHDLGIDTETHDVLDYDYIETVSRELSEIVSLETVYPGDEIDRGRSYGTPGERYAKNLINDRFLYDCGLNPVLEEIDSSFDEFKRDPGLTVVSGNYNYRSKVEHNDLMDRLDWVGKRKTYDSVDMKINVPVKTMVYPMFSCRFHGAMKGIHDQQYGLINHFHLEESVSNRYFGFGFTVDSDHVPEGYCGLRGEFFDGSTLYTTGWIVIGDDCTCYPEVYIMGNRGYLTVGDDTESVSVGGSFDGEYDEFHFKLGEQTGSYLGNGAEGWFDDLEIGTVRSGYIHYGVDRVPEGKLNVSSKQFFMKNDLGVFEEITECYISPQYTHLVRLVSSYFDGISFVDHDCYDLSMVVPSDPNDPLDVHAAPDDLSAYNYVIDNYIIPDLLNENPSFDGYNDFFAWCFNKINLSYPILDLFNLDGDDACNIPWFDYCQVYDDDFVYIEENPMFNPSVSPPNWGKWMENLVNFRYQFRYYVWSLIKPKCKGIIHYDHNTVNSTYDMNLNAGYSLPIISIAHDQGYDLHMAVINDDDSRSDWVKFNLHQTYEPDIESYNVIGEIPGSNPDETVIIGCLYDSWWNQGAADSAIGIGMMLSIAKYFHDNGITPNRNLRFVAFAGEEQGLKGAWFYESVHRYDENVVAYIDLNQLGMSQPSSGDPRLRFVIPSCREGLNHTMEGITDVFDYEESTGDTADFWLRTHDVFDYPSDHTPFQKRSSCDIIGFIKAHEDRKWRMHHRDGESHDAGDAMYYYFEDDVKVTVDMIWETVKYLTIDT